MTDEESKKIICWWKTTTTTTSLHRLILTIPANWVPCKDWGNIMVGSRKCLVQGQICTCLGRHIMIAWHAAGQPEVQTELGTYHLNYSDQCECPQALFGLLLILLHVHSVMWLGAQLEDMAPWPSRSVPLTHWISLSNFNKVLSTFNKVVFSLPSRKGMTCWPTSTRPTCTDSLAGSWIASSLGRCVMSGGSNHISRWARMCKGTWVLVNSEHNDTLGWRASDCAGTRFWMKVKRTNATDCTWELQLMARRSQRDSVESAAVE